MAIDHDALVRHVFVTAVRALEDVIARSRDFKWAVEQLCELLDEKVDSDAAVSMVVAEYEAAGMSASGVQSHGFSILELLATQHGQLTSVLLDEMRRKIENGESLPDND